MNSYKDKLALVTGASTGIGYAISFDEGKTFKRIGDGPILSPSLNEPFLVGDPFVKIINEIFHMWYIFGKEWKANNKDAQPDRIYKIGHAFSKKEENIFE